MATVAPGGAEFGSLEPPSAGLLSAAGEASAETSEEDASAAGDADAPALDGFPRWSIEQAPSAIAAPTTIRRNSKRRVATRLPAGASSDRPSRRIINLLAEL